LQFRSLNIDGVLIVVGTRVPAVPADQCQIGGPFGIERHVPHDHIRPTTPAGSACLSHGPGMLWYFDLLALD
jgi:hypothetical protein